MTPGIHPMLWLAAAYLAASPTTAEETVPMTKPIRVVFTGDSITGWSDLTNHLRQAA
jgi:hypothetical protein